MLVHRVIRVHAVLVVVKGRRGAAGILLLLLLLMGIGGLRLLKYGDETVKYVAFDRIFTFGKAFDEHGDYFSVVVRLQDIMLRNDNGFDALGCHTTNLPREIVVVGIGVLI